MLPSMRTYWGKSPSCQGHHQMWGKNKSNPTQMWGRRPSRCINSPLELLTLPPRPMHTRVFTSTEQTAAETHVQMCSCHGCKHSGLARRMQRNGEKLVFSCTSWEMYGEAHREREEMMIRGFRRWSFKPPLRRYGSPKPSIPGTYEYWNILPCTIFI